MPLTKDENKNAIRLEKKKVIFWLSQFANGDINDEHFRRQVIEMLVNSVTIWDEPDGWYKVTTTFNLSSQSTSTFRCSENKDDGSPTNSTPRRGVLFVGDPRANQIPRTCRAST